MKKLLYIAAIFSLSVNAYAQDEETTTTEGESSAENLSINGKQITPVAGDIGLGFNAASIIGNVLADNGRAVTGTSINGANEIFGRYFLSDDMAVRARFGFRQDANTTTYSVLQDKQNDPNVRVNDKRTQTIGNFNLALGVEMRRGEGRVQGYYGGELNFFRNNNSTIYDYGNAMTLDNQRPTTIFGSGNTRTIASYGNTTYGINLNGLIGVEYFIGPKISIGGEFMTGFIYSGSNAGENQTETWSDDGIEYRVSPNAISGRWGWSTDASGGIYANFYF